MTKIDSPAGEGSPVVTRYNFASGQYMRPSQYGEAMHGLDMQTDNRNTRMGVKGNSPMRNYMVGNGNSPMNRGGANMFPSQIEGYQFLTTNGGFVDHHSSQSNTIGQNMFSGTPHYLRPQSNNLSGSNYSNMHSVIKDGSGGYQYKQFANGTLQIMKSPSGGVGTMIYTNSPYWGKITKEIGEYGKWEKAGKVLSKGQELLESEQGQTILTSLFDNFTSKKNAQTSEYDLIAEQNALSAQQIKDGQKPSMTEKIVPYVAIVGVIGAIGTIVYLATKK